MDSTVFAIIIAECIGKSMNEVKPISELWQELPPDLQQQVRDFAEFLANKHLTSAKPLQLKWAGALREYKHLSALDLQRSVLENWGVSSFPGSRLGTQF